MYNFSLNLRHSHFYIQSTKEIDNLTNVLVNIWYINTTDTHLCRETFEVIDV